MAKMEISLFGPFQVLLNGAPVTTFESVKVRALLAFLATETNHPQPREHLAALLWPDWPQQSAMSNLRYALADLRKVIGDRDAQPRFLLVTRESLQLNREAGIGVDVIEFEKGIGDKGQGSQVSDLQSSIETSVLLARNLQSAISLYRGHFLEGFSLNDSPAFEEWLLAKREYFSQQVLKALSHLAEWSLEQGEYEQAEGYARRQIELEPWREQAHQQLMRALSLKGERVQALAQFESLRKALQRELKIEPSEETVELYQQIRDGKPEVRKEALAEAVPQPPVPFEKPRHNLPRQLTRFIGRDQQVAQVVELVQQNALVTLSGPGGVGKTRLGLAAAQALLREFQDGVWLIELAPVTDANLVPQVLASTLGVREESGRPTVETLAMYFRGRETLLVLDNCEHLVEVCAFLANTLLSAAPRLKLLATSREALEVPGEVAYRVPSLSFPPPGQAQEMDTLQQYEAVQLFYDRARAVVTDFHLTAGNIAFVVQICQRLDGIPLAIELAAARAASLEVADIASHLDHAFRLLAGGSRAALERHRTLRATVDWSYNLLSTPECTLLQRLSVFAGSWTLEAAEAVCAEQGIAEEAVVDLLSQLVNKSMVQVNRSPESGLRYRMLETIRQYSAGKIVETGESECLRNRHLAYFVAFAERIEDGLRGPELVTRLNRLEAELDNFRLALDWGLQTDVLSELRLASALMWFWHIHSNHRNEGIAWLEQGLHAEEEARGRQKRRAEAPRDAYRDQVWAKASSAAGFQLYILEKDKQAITLLEDSLALFRNLEGDQRWWIAFDLLWLGNCHGSDSLLEQSQALFEEIGDKNRIGDCLFLRCCNTDDPQLARQLSHTSLAVQKESGDIDGIATATQNMGHVALRFNEYQQAIEWYQKSIVGFRQVGNYWSVANQLRFIGKSAYWWLGDFPQALRNFKDAATIYREVGDHNYYFECIFLQSHVYLSDGLYTQARETLEIALSLGRELSNGSIQAAALCTLARMDWLNGDVLQASRRLEESLAITECEPVAEYYRLTLAGWLALGNGDFANAETAFKKGMQLVMKEHIASVPARELNDLARLAVRSGEMERVARLIGAAERYFSGLVYTLSPIERGWREQDIQSARTALGDEGYQAQYDLGRAMSLEQAIAYALEDAGKLGP
jgi:predicted ATPase/DNA-binding SARP family transcriptional activator